MELNMVYAVFKIPKIANIEWSRDQVFTNADDAYRYVQIMNALDSDDEYTVGCIRPCDDKWQDLFASMALNIQSGEIVMINEGPHEYAFPTRTFEDVDWFVTDIPLRDVEEMLDQGGKEAVYEYVRKAYATMQKEKHK